MPKFLESTFSYDYSFPAVTLAYFLRYPNPYATHVLSSDVISRHFDPQTQTLSTTRLHLKRSKLPPAVLKLLPKALIGAATRGPDGGSQAYILEKSVVDLKKGRMETESRNLEWTGVLSVIERQVYSRPPNSVCATGESPGNLAEHAKDETTDVTTSATFISRFGQAKILSSKQQRHSESPLPPSSSSSSSADDEPAPVKKPGFFSTWSTSSLQRTIEAMGMRRTRDALVKSKDGMNVVLERLRLGGLGGVLEGMRRDQELVFGNEAPWKRVWNQQQGRNNGEEGTGRMDVRDPFEDE